MQMFKTDKVKLLENDKRRGLTNANYALYVTETELRKKSRQFLV